MIWAISPEKAVVINLDKSLESEATVYQPVRIWQYQYNTIIMFQVSTMKCGLLPLSQESCLIGDVSYHSYNGIVIDPEERESLAKDLGPNNKV